MIIKRHKRGFKPIFLVAAAIIPLVAILAFSVFPKNKSTPHTNIADLKISTQTGRAVTKNAVIADPRFKNITFVESPKKKSLIEIEWAAVFRAVKSVIEKPFEKEETPERGSWLWTPIMQITPIYAEEMVSKAAAENINVIYLAVDSYLDIFVMEKDAEREVLKKEFANVVEDFITKANKRGIEVDALGGWRNWAEEGHLYKALAIADFVRHYNETSNRKFRGFQYDVEPYLLETFEKEPEKVLKNFVRLIDQTEYFLRDSDLRFSVVVPDFFDAKDKFTPKFEYNGKKNHAFEHVLNILEKRKGSSVIVMSYRNFAEGRDGAVEITQNEMQTAKKGSYRSRIIVAQETGNFPPPYITFHNTSRAQFEQEIAKINSAFSSHPNFGGIAIHYLNSFLDLK